MTELKRKLRTPTPSRQYQGSKRLCIGERPSTIGSGNSNSFSTNASNRSNSSPLSEVPSEKVPTQFAYSILEAQREADEKGFGLDYHAFAFSELQKAVRRLEGINADGLLDSDAIEYITIKIGENIAAKANSSLQSSASSTTSDTFFEAEQGSSFPAVGRESFGSEAGPTLDFMGADHHTKTHSPESVAGNNYNLHEVNLLHSEPATQSVATETMGYVASYVESSTQGVSLSRPPYTEAATQTTLDSTAPVSYAEASTQTPPTAPVSDIELWKRQLAHIRREKPLAPLSAREIVVRCPRKEPQRSAPLAAHGATSASTSTHMQKTSAATPQSSRASWSARSQSQQQQQQQQQRRHTAPVVVLDSDEEDETNVTLPPPNSSRHDSAFRVGGASSSDPASDPSQHSYHDASSGDPIKPVDGTYTIQVHELREEQQQETRGHDRARNHSWREVEGFYGLERGASGTERGRYALRYQDPRNSNGYTALPSPMTGHQLQLKRYLENTNTTHRRDVGAEIAHVLKRTSWGVCKGLDEEAIEARWQSSLGVNGDGGETHVMRGFPLIEDVRFLAPANHGKPSGDCYWRSVAAHMYGGDAEGHWDLVKAEHLGFVYHVLTTGPSHPRYTLYAEQLNARFFDTTSSAITGVDGAGGRTRDGPFKANLWQVLHLAHVWTPALMQQVTADLYGVCLVTFSVDVRPLNPSQYPSPSPRMEMVVTETTMRGSYNARHIFLLYNAHNSHFQPLLPADHLASEFQYPRPTVAATAPYSFAPKDRGTGGRKMRATEHAWRREFTPSVPPPVPRLHGCHVDKLRGLMGSRPRS